MSTDPLAQLKDIHTPDPVGWWPPAPLWWLLALALLITLVWYLVRVVQKKRRRAYRQRALALWHELPQAAGGEQCQAVNALLKRTALHTYGEACAHLYGEAWLRFLDSTLPGDEQAFSSGPGRVLASGPYQPQPHYDSDALLALARRWISQHRPDKGGQPHA